ncbi:MAG: NADH:ubiquinone oxidoreductase [Bacteroidales bacterium]|nr:NADH:ubiquinone oxidoreductase [Bacteroidales bacterium]
MFNEAKIILHNGKQYIPDIRTASVTSPFRGRPVISGSLAPEEEIAELCPTNAISVHPLTIDLKKCTFCGECALRFPEKISFTNDHKLATNDPEQLIIRAGEDRPITINKSLIRNEIKGFFKRSFKLRQVSAGGDNSAEFELNASSNANFDMGRFGLEFVASPRHADGVLVTGPITGNMAEALQIAVDAVPEPKVFILCGTDAISGGIFEGSPALKRDILLKIKPDLYIPGNPPHPLTIINGLLDLLGR